MKLRRTFVFAIFATALWPQAGPERKVFWAFRSPAAVVPPGPAGGNPIDAFLAAKLAAKGLSFSPRAENRILIRRLHYDLTGLPPKLEDYKQTYESTLERLLASPHYGERWGRHWLDVVRFGESDGGEHNYERWHAWRYRDYVIDAFNQDKPYPQFIREQIAGDLLEPENPKMVAATGFLVAGPWDQVSSELNKDKLMTMTARLDELDDMVTTTFHTFQALTVNCARCHNHKFDPIPAKDFYKLTAVFRGVTFGTRTVATAETTAAYETKVKPLRDHLAGLRAALSAIESPVRARIALSRYVDFDKARAQDPRRIPINPIYNRNQFAPTTAPHWRFVILKHQGKRGKLAEVRLNGNIALRDWTGTVEAKDDAPVAVDLQSPGTMPVGEVFWSTDPVRGERDGHPTIYRLEASTDGKIWNTICSSLDHVRSLEVDLPFVEDVDVLAKLGTADKAERERLKGEISSVEKSIAAIPEPVKVYAAKPTALTAAHLLDRGSVAKPIEEVLPGALTAITEPAPEFNLPADATDAQRRLALASWIANPKNPLTARVIVNRIWYYHFGTGIVNTPSDFGLMGDRPSHPELLDWLAVWFMDNGWSLKKLHKLILSSQAYQQASQFNAKAAEVDADNRLHWRFSPHRMDAESVRDTMLALAGNLRLEESGGPSFLLQKKGERGSYIYKALDNDGPEVWRRAIYRFVVRGGERIMLDSFDCPDPAVATPQRTISNTAVQALTLFNNDFVLKQSRFLAARLQREFAADPLAGAYSLLLGRSPSAKERQLGEAFLKDNPLDLYCRVLINSNEFQYVP